MPKVPKVLEIFNFSSLVTLAHFSSLTTLRFCGVFLLFSSHTAKIEIAAGVIPAIREAWTDWAGPIGKRLSVHDGDIRKNGILSGFGEHGELLLETETGLETIWSGDVT